MKSLRRHIVLLLMLVSTVGQAQQIVQNFNESTNQIGNCWWNYNMYIETQNTINNALEKKALMGKTPLGSPAYFFMSPMMYMNGTGSITFRHRLSDTSGIDRSMSLYLLNRDETFIINIYDHIYIQADTFPNGDPTITVNVTIPITWTGEFFLRWEFYGSGGGTSLAMVDDIYIDATDISDGDNDNGYGYCRADDEVWDTVCAGEVQLLTVPYPIQISSWSWDFWPGSSVGILDSTYLAGDKDTTVEISWSYNALGDYQFEVTEIRPPYNTTTYSVLFNVHVLPGPIGAIAIDTVCPKESNTVSLQFVGSGPWTVEYTVDGITYSKLFTSSSDTIRLPSSATNQTFDIISVTDANGCDSDDAANPALPAVVYPAVVTGPIYHN